MINIDVIFVKQNKTMNSHMQFGRRLWDALYITTYNTNRLFKNIT